MKDTLSKVQDAMDLDRTNELFDANIKSADAMSGKPFTKESVKNMAVTIAAGNLHVGSAKVQLSALRMVGYVNGVKQLKRSVDRKVRNSKRHR